jgi:hypothetical protein
MAAASFSTPFLPLLTQRSRNFLSRWLRSGSVLCSTWLPPRSICTGTVPTFTAAVARVQKIRFYGAEVRSRSKMHVTVGHTTGETGCLGGLGCNTNNGRAALFWHEGCMPLSHCCLKSTHLP